MSAVWIRPEPMRLALPMPSMGSAPTVALYIVLRPGRRIVSTLFSSKPEGTILRYMGKDSEGRDWYDVNFDKFPDLVHQVAREGMKPLKKNHRPLYGDLSLLSAEVKMAMRAMRRAT